MLKTSRPTKQRRYSLREVGVAVIGEDYRSAVLARQ
jgi:hypothetical protein